MYIPIYRSFFKMVHGDSEQTLSVLVTYYRQKTESLVNTVLQVNRNVIVPKHQENQYDTAVEFVKLELD